MSMTWTPWLDRREAERLLDGDGDASRTARVIDAATRPATPDELAREDAAVAHVPPCSPRRPRRRLGGGRRPLGRVGAPGGAAKALAAAGRWSCSRPPASPWPPASGAVVRRRSRPPGAHVLRGVRDGATTRRTPRVTPVRDAGASGAGTRTPLRRTRPATHRPTRGSGRDVRGLCIAVLAGRKGETGRALEAPRFAELVEAAGGVANVSAYCTRHCRERGGCDASGTAGNPGNPGNPASRAGPGNPGSRVDRTSPGRPDDPGRPDNPGNADTGTPAAAARQHREARPSPENPGSPGRP